MTRAIKGGVVVVVWLATAVVCPSGRAELHWQTAKKEQIRVRLVALAWNHTASSFFANEEVFIAEKELAPEESRLVKLVYGFLPYQPRLSAYGLDYSMVHEVSAVRDPECDETLGQHMAGEVGDWRHFYGGLRYSSDAPPLNLARHKSALPCYLTTAEDYHRPLH